MSFDRINLIKTEVAEGTKGAKSVGERIPTRRFSYLYTRQWLYFKQRSAQEQWAGNLKIPLSYDKRNKDNGTTSIDYCDWSNNFCQREQCHGRWMGAIVQLTIISVKRQTIVLRKRLLSARVDGRWLGDSRISGCHVWQAMGSGPVTSRINDALFRDHAVPADPNDCRTRQITWVYQCR